MNPFGVAVLNGYNAVQILGYLKGLSSSLKKKIEQAEKLGHKPEQIVNFFYNKAESEINSSYKTSNRVEAQRRQEDAEKVKKALGIGVGVAALGTYALSRGIGAATTPSNLTSSGAVRPSAIYQGAQQPRQIGAPQQRLGLPAPAQRAGVTQPPPTAPQPTATASIQTNNTRTPATSNISQAPQTKIPAVQVAQNLNLTPHIQSLQKNYKDPAQVAAILYTQFPKEMQQLQKESGVPMEQAVSEVLQTMPQQAEQKIQPAQEHLPEIEEPPKPIKLEKKTKVITPEGDIGEITQISGKNALINTDEGKKNQKLDKLEAITPEFNDVLENYERLIESIPEEHKSAVVNFIGYDPDRRKLSVRFHNGDQYNYEDLDEEDVQKIADAFHLAKTSGKNEFGAWSPNDPSRGAGIHKLIMELQKKYGGKGKEYSAKFKTLYDYFALPKRLLEEKKKRLKDEERARKKPKKA